MDEFWLHGSETYEEERSHLLEWISRMDFPEHLKTPCALVLCKSYDDHALDMSMLLHGNDNVTRYVENLEFPNALAEYISENHVTLYQALSELDVVDLNYRVSGVESQIQYQQEQISDLGSLIDAVDRRVGRVEGLIDPLETQVAELDVVVGTLDDSVSNLTFRTEFLETEVEAGHDQIRLIKSIMVDLEKQFLELERSFNELSTVVGKNSAEINRLKESFIEKGRWYLLQFQNEPTGNCMYIQDSPLC
jgi:archaellum component FlaC